MGALALFKFIFSVLFVCFKIAFRGILFSFSDFLVPNEFVLIVFLGFAIFVAFLLLKFDGLFLTGLMMVGLIKDLVRLSFLFLSISDSDCFTS